MDNINGFFEPDVVRGETRIELQHYLFRKKLIYSLKTDYIP